MTLLDLVRAIVAGDDAEALRRLPPTESERQAQGGLASPPENPRRDGPPSRLVP